MTTERITEKTYFEMIIGALRDELVGHPIEDLVSFCEKKIATLDARTEKARARAAAKREAGDPLQDLVYSVLTDEPATRSEVFDRVVATGEAPEDVSIAKVGYRLTALTTADRAVKSEVSAEGADGKQHRYAAYALA